MILLINNHDSFIYNLYQEFGKKNPNIIIKSSDEITVEEVENLSPTHIIISSGTDLGKSTGASIKIIKAFSGKLPILGIGLGSFLIAAAFGGGVVAAVETVYGKEVELSINNKSLLFKGMAEQIQGGGYFSQVINPTTLPSCFNIIARDSLGQIMGISHQSFKLYGVGFHPENILTPLGGEIIGNFLEL